MGREKGVEGGRPTGALDQLDVVVAGLEGSEGCCDGTRGESGEEKEGGC